MIEHLEGTYVRKQVTVNVSRERAFEVFATRFDSWWPRSHHIAEVDMAAAIIEPRAGGRFYERGVDGSECDWGKVLAFDPPERLLLAWQLTADWTYDPGFETEVEVRFVEEGPTRTRVELEHRHLDRYGARQAEMAQGLGGDGGWGGLLVRYAEATA